jgi:hypothetical protein
MSVDVCFLMDSICFMSSAIFVLNLFRDGMILNKDEIKKMENEFNKKLIIENGSNLELKTIENLEKNNENNNFEIGEEKLTILENNNDEFINEKLSEENNNEISNNEIKKENSEDNNEENNNKNFILMIFDLIKYFFKHPDIFILCLSGI